MNELTVEEMASIYGGVFVFQSGNKQISVGNVNLANSGNAAILSAGILQKSGDANAGNQSIGGN
jgi:bacteriocin-like protein